MARFSLTTAEKQFITQRARRCCEYCLSQADFSPDPFSIEHIIPIAKGGTNRLENLALSCQGCNNRKYTHTEAIDPVTGNIVPLYHPRQQQWNNHFVWSQDFTRMIGTTPIGRATIKRLDLNRLGVMNLRELLASIHRHPPF
ncbi:MAG: HNH endonuclease [Leptolyngbya sp. DLM2.Bin15]|nr:MAG: HNH endonuclease [Leptolyngbya sp. DLM2.Bin15]